MFYTHSSICFRRLSRAFSDKRQIWDLFPEFYYLLLSQAKLAFSSVQGAIRLLLILRLWHYTFVYTSIISHLQCCTQHFSQLTRLMVVARTLLREDRHWALLMPSLAYQISLSFADNFSGIYLGIVLDYNHGLTFQVYFSHCALDVVLSTLFSSVCLRESHLFSSLE